MFCHVVSQEGANLTAKQLQPCVLPEGHPETWRSNAAWARWGGAGIYKSSQIPTTSRYCSTTPTAGVDFGTMQTLRARTEFVWSIGSFRLDQMSEILRNSLLSGSVVRRCLCKQPGLLIANWRRIQVRGCSNTPLRTKGDASAGICATRSWNSSRPDWTISVELQILPMSVPFSFFPCLSCFHFAGSDLVWYLVAGSFSHRRRRCCCCCCCCCRQHRDRWYCSCVVGGWWML